MNEIDPEALRTCSEFQQGFVAVIQGYEDTYYEGYLIESIACIGTTQCNVEEKRDNSKNVEKA